MLKVGNDMKLYYNSGTNESPTWVEICIVGDVTVDHAINDAEVDLRCSQWLLNLPAKHSGSINIFLANSIGLAIWSFLNTMAFSRTITQFASANANIATSGTEYFKAYCHFSNFPWGQPTQEIASHDATLSLSWKENSQGAVIEPSWNVVP
jgi:hypothetical protein